MKILITGANGIVGSELINSLPINYKIYTITNKKINESIKKKISHNLIYKNIYIINHQDQVITYIYNC
mgnify:CR=1 FL=1